MIAVTHCFPVLQHVEVCKDNACIQLCSWEFEYAQESRLHHTGCCDKQAMVRSISNLEFEIPSSQ